MATCESTSAGRVPSWCHSTLRCPPFRRRDPETTQQRCWLQPSGPCTLPELPGVQVPQRESPARLCTKCPGMRRQEPGEPGCAPETGPADTRPVLSLGPVTNTGDDYTTYTTSEGRARSSEGRKHRAPRAGIGVLRGRSEDPTCPPRCGASERRPVPLDRERLDSPPSMLRQGTPTSFNLLNLLKSKAARASEAGAWTGPGARGRLQHSPAAPCRCHPEGLCCLPASRLEPGPGSPAGLGLGDAHKPSLLPRALWGDAAGEPSTRAEALPHQPQPSRAVRRPEAERREKTPVNGSSRHFKPSPPFSVSKTRFH